MSVIVKEEGEGNKILLLSKGADTVITARLTQESKESQTFIKTTEAVDKYAAQGLRTLYLA